MLSSYSNDQPQINNADSYNFNNISNSNSSPGLNNYGNQYMNTVKENRSKYGNYLDNQLSYDPYKEQKSAFNVVYADNVYNPWGKPGGGAPKLNNNTGQLQTKIAGTLQWNLTGETEADRISRSMNNRSHTNQNLQMFKKNALPSEMSPRGLVDTRTNTTYNYNFREPINGIQNSQPKPIENQQVPNFPMSSPGRMGGNAEFDNKLQQEAEVRSLNRSNQSMTDNLRPKGFQELNRISNKLNTDNQPSNAYPNISYWFGRAGQHKTTIGGFEQNTGPSYSNDPRRRKLLDALEHRTPRDMPQVYGIDNSQLTKQNTNIAFVNDAHSNHRNSYENQY